MLELYGTASCPYTAQLREDLVWRGVRFIEYDVESDKQALQHMLEVSNGDRLVPLLVEDDRIVQAGYEGRGCYAGGL
jgi:glutaredoxin 3